MLISLTTSCMRTTFGCLINFIVAISRLIYDSTRVTHQQLEKQVKSKATEFWEKCQFDLYHKKPQM